MNIISIDDIHKHFVLINETVKVFAWVKHRRDSKCGISFLDVYDGSSVNTIQVIVNKNISNYNTEILRLTVGCSIYIEGKVVLSIGKQQKYEIQAYQIVVIGWVEFPESYPVSAKNHTYEYLREIPHLRSRTNFISVVTRIRNSMSHAIHNFLYKRKYYWIPTPIITSLNSEGAGEMFRVSTLDPNNLPKNQDGSINFKRDFFGKESFLTVSGQLTLEAYACSMGKVYSFGPTFRAENSNTTRHLSEFWMLEVEQAFSDLHDISIFSEKIIKYIINCVLNDCNSEIQFLCNLIHVDIFEKLEKFLVSKIIHINYVDAVNILKNTNYHFKNPVYMNMNLSSEHEKYLVDHYFCNAVFIKNFPKNLKAFYMKLNDDNYTVSSMDLLIPGIGEILGGSQREENKLNLENRLLELGLNKKDYSWYLDLRKYGSVPHSGFGLGFERLISYITGIQNVKDLIPFPRTVNNALC